MKRTRAAMTQEANTAAQQAAGAHDVMQQCGPEDDDVMQQCVEGNDVTQDGGDVTQSYGRNILVGVDTLPAWLA